MELSTTTNLKMSRIEQSVKKAFGERDPFFNSIIASSLVNLNTAEKEAIINVVKENNLLIKEEFDAYETPEYPKSEPFFTFYGEIENNKEYKE